MPGRVSATAAAGVALLVVGVILVIASFVPIPVVKAILLDETFELGAGKALARCFKEPFPPGTTLHITVEVLSGGDRKINFLVMDEPEWRVFEAGDSPYHYAVPSRRSATEVRVTWNPPSDRRLCFVFDNTSSTASKTVRAEITMIRYLTLDRLLEAGVLALVAGAILLIASRYTGAQQKPAGAQH